MFKHRFNLFVFNIHLIVKHYNVFFEKMKKRMKKKQYLRRMSKRATKNTHMSLGKKMSTLPKNIHKKMANKNRKIYRKKRRPTPKNGSHKKENKKKE